MSKQRPQIPLTTGKRLGPRHTKSGVSRSLGNSLSQVPTSPEAKLPHGSIGYSASQPAAPGLSGTLPDELSGVRRGSPFAEGTARRIPLGTAVGVSQVGTGLPLASAMPATDSTWGRSISSETANGATIATWLIFPLSLLATSVFPAGAVIVSLLGLVLALFGIASRWHRISLAALFSHLLCAGFAYSKILS